MARPDTDFEIIVGYRHSESHCILPYGYCTCLARFMPIGEAVLEKHSHMCAGVVLCCISAKRGGEAHPDADFENIVGYRRCESCFICTHDS